MTEDKQKKIEECKQYFINNMPTNIFNIHFNTFIALNSINFKIEMNMKKSIKYYFLYFYKKYYDEFISKLEENKITNKTFIEYLEEMIKKVIGIERFNDFIDEVSEDINMDDLNLIRKEYEKIKENEKRPIDFGIDFDDEESDSVNTLKGLYKLFTEKKYFPPISENTKEVINYFNNYTTETIKGIYKVKKKNKKTNLDINLEKLDEIFNEIKLYIDEDKKDINSFTSIIDSKLKRINKFIKNGKNIYIPLIGISSAGKSTILNCLIGYKLFPESDGECTTRGIIIQYGKKAKLYEVKIESENNFYVFEKDRLLSQNVKKVQEYLKCLNYEYGKDESKYFYLIKTPIKFFDDHKFPQTLKKKIFFIDLPGSDTQNNKFNDHNKTERTAYEKLLDISSSFVFINKGRGITTTTNKKLLSQAYNAIRDNTSLGQNYIKNCLFVVNMFQKLDKKEKDISEIQKDISTVIFENEEVPKEYRKIINVSLFDAKAYIEYLNINQKICNKKKLFNELKNEFIEKGKNNFTKFCLNRIKTKIKDLSIKIDENFESDIEFYDNIKREILSIMNGLKINSVDVDFINIKKISNILQYANIKMKENKFYLNSNCEVFFRTLEKQILDAKEHVEMNYNINLNDCFKYFDLIFEKDIVPEETKNHKSYQNKFNEIIQNIEKLEEKYEIEKIFDKYLSQILNLFKDIIENKDTLIKKYDNKLEELINKELKEKSAVILENLNQEIEKTMKDIDNEVNKCKDKVIELFKKGLKKEIKAGKYNSEIEILINFSFVERIKLTICNLFGKETSILLKIGIFNLITIGLFAATNPILLITNGVISLICILGLILGRHKTRNKMLEKKLEEIKEQCEINFSRMRIKFTRIYLDTLNFAKNKFRELLSLSCVDLSKIEKEKWENLNQKYRKIKDNIKQLSKEKIN